MPLYLDGNAAGSRFDPAFLVSDGTDQRPVPVNGNSLSVTGGIGWDIPLAEHWTLRPIFNLARGYVTSDLKVAKWWIGNRTDVEFEFLDRGKMSAPLLRRTPAAHRHRTGTRRPAPGSEGGCSSWRPSQSAGSA